VQENIFSAYVKLDRVSQPKPLGRFNNRNEPLFLVRATGVCSVGTKNVESRFSLDYREVDLVFMDLTERHVGMLVEKSEVNIFGASVISYNANIQYPLSMISHLVNKDFNVDEPLASANNIIEGIVSKICSNDSEADSEEIAQQLSKIIQDKRRTTTIKILPMRWRVVASPAQLQKAQQDSTPVDSIEELI
jgi:hypothetical protein